MKRAVILCIAAISPFMFSIPTTAQATNPLACLPEPVQDVEGTGLIRGPSWELLVGVGKGWIRTKRAVAASAEGLDSGATYDVKYQTAQIVDESSGNVQVSVTQWFFRAPGLTRAEAPNKGVKVEHRQYFTRGDEFVDATCYRFPGEPLPA